MQKTEQLTLFQRVEILRAYIPRREDKLISSLHAVLFVSSCADESIYTTIIITPWP
jgi:hypothetical protein